MVKATVFLKVTYGCESWTIKKAEWQNIDAFKLWCWRGLLRVPWTGRRSNQSILKEMNPEYPLEGLKQQYFGHLMQRADTLEKPLILGKRRGQQRTRAGWHHWLDVWAKPRDSKGQGSLACCNPWGLRVRYNWATEEQPFCHCLRVFLVWLFFFF